MSYVAKAYEFLGKVEALFNRKMFKVCFIAIASMVMFFGVMNIYAAEDNSGTVEGGDVTSVKVSPDTTGIKSFINLAWGLITHKDEDNMGTQLMLTATNAVYSGVAVMAPGITAGGDEINKSGSGVPEDMKQGLLGLEDTAITYAYTNYPATSVTEHLANEWVPGYKAANTSTYAAENASDSGYNTLINSGIEQLWVKIRDIAYLFFVIVMIVVGFMIMFRSKIGGQTLVSIGNFLPGVIVSLILITFSFAIAGIMIDIGGVITNLIISLYTTGNGAMSASDLISTNGIFGMVWGMFTKGSQTWSGNLGLFSVSSILAVVAAIVIAILNPGSAALGLLAFVLLLIVAGIVFVGAVKVIITLFKAYFGILLSVIIGPIQLMIGAFPGAGYNISNWFKSLLRNVLTFPMVFAIVNLPNFLAAQGGITLELPDKLTNGANSSFSLDVTSWIVMLILRIVVLYFAAQAPKYLEAWFPADTPKPVAEGLANATESLSKIPLVGGLFKK
jgi:hypothetical protein